MTIESSYRDDRGRLTSFSYSLDSVVRLHLVFRVLGLLSILAALPCLLFGLLFLFDSPTQPVLGFQLLGGALVSVLFGVFLWFGLANLVLMLVDLRGRLDRLPRD